MQCDTGPYQHRLRELLDILENTKSIHLYNSKERVEIIDNCMDFGKDLLSRYASYLIR